jgi:hypothetical protein
MQEKRQKDVLKRFHRLQQFLGAHQDELFCPTITREITDIREALDGLKGTEP